MWSFNFTSHFFNNDGQFVKYYACFVYPNFSKKLTKFILD